MKLVNPDNLPNRIISMLHPPYQPKVDRWSISQLCDSPLIRTLMLTKWDDLVISYSDLLTSVIGISVHSASELANKDDNEVEHKHETKIDGVVVAGKSDCYSAGTKTITDTKVRSTDFKRFGYQKEIKQLNYYAYQHRVLGKPVEHLILDVWYRDWKGWKAKIEKDYPKLPYEQITIPLWTFDEQEASIKSDLQYHITCPNECSPTDRWTKDPTWAVMKEGQKRAVRVFDCKGDALTYKINQNSEKLSVVERPGEETRCINYCLVRNVCPFALALKA